MAIIRPFNALRPAAEHAAEVAAVPYDVVNTEEARALASGNPFSFLHVSRPEIDLPDGTPIYSDEVYGKAADNSATWGSMFKQQVERCWKKPYGGIESQKPEVAFAIRLKRDGSLEGTPIPEGVPATPFLRVYQESALRAIIECQPYKLPAAFYEEWKYFAPVFKEKV